MASASPSLMTHSIHVNCKRVFDWHQEGQVPAGEPHLLLGLGCVINLNQTEIANTLFKSQHSFINCSPSILESFIQETEPLPMDCLMEHEDAELTRLRISHSIAHHVRSCIGVAGLKRLQVDVITKVYVEQQEDVVQGSSTLRERRMALVQKIDVYARDGMGTEEVCSVCLEEMVEGGKEVVVRTPCRHQFHARCIGRWFEKSGFCPLCRFDIDPSS